MNRETYSLPKCSDQICLLVIWSVDCETVCKLGYFQNGPDKLTQRPIPKLQLLFVPYPGSTFPRRFLLSMRRGRKLLSALRTRGIVLVDEVGG